MFFLWATLPCSVLDYQPDLFLLFSHSITSLLSYLSLSELICSQELNTFRMQVTPSVLLPARTFLWFQTCIFSYLLPVTSTCCLIVISNVTGPKLISVFLLNFQICIPHSWPLPPLSSNLPYLIVITVPSLFRSDTWMSSLFHFSWFLTPHPIHQCGLWAWPPEYHKSSIPSTLLI